MKAITAPTLSQGPVKLLYLEDDETDRRAFVRMVQEKKLPYELTHAQSLAEARARLAGATFDLIVADYHLPDGHSTELFDEVPETPFILITGTPDEQLALRTLERGADDYLPKAPRGRHLEAVPFTIDKVLHRKIQRERERLLTRQLQESEERYRTLFHAIDEGFCVIEVLFDQNQKPIDYRFLQTNPAFAKLVSPNAEGKTGRELTPDIEQYWFDLFGKVALTGQPVRYQNRVAAWNRWFEGYAFSLGPLGNRQVGIIFNEITARKRTEEALRESEERARLAVETAALGTYERNLATNEITMNPVCRQILGVGQESPPQDLAPRSLHPDDADYVLTTVARAYDPALREVCAGEFRILRPDRS
ncbi:MAG TPA: response regulator, partial [Tepidisphaeraceae bacterium]|nr:response regulator [Tepidisphaeraceae bacterium]